MGLKQALSKIQQYSDKISVYRLFCLALICELINIAYYAGFYYYHQYLPAPFVWNKQDSFMDFYNPLYWVIKDGFYTTFNSVYPALNYYILKIFSFGLSSFVVLDPYDFRTANSNLSIFLVLVYLLIIFAVTRLGEWRKLADTSPILNYWICAASVPVLFALERGNLIFIALLFLALYLHVSGSWAKAFYLALLINMKPYFVILMLQYINRHRFDWKIVLKIGFISVLVFVIFGFFAHIDFIRFIKAYVGLAKAGLSSGALSVDGVIALPHNLASLAVIENILYLPEGPHIYAHWFSAMKIIGLLGPVLLLIISFIKPLSKEELLISACLVIMNFSTSTGGYILLIYIILLPYFLQSSHYRQLAILALLIFALPLDFIHILKSPYTEVTSYFAGDIVTKDVELWIALGTVVRPICNFLVLTLFFIGLLRKYQDSFFLNKSAY